MNEQEKYINQWMDLHSKMWLTPNLEKPMNSKMYLDYFHEKRGDFFVTRSILPYTIGLLEANKDNIVFTAHLIPDGNHAQPYTVIQKNVDFHIIADWLWIKDEDRFYFLPTLFFKNMREYSDFMKENSQFQYKQSATTMGFGNVHGMGA